MGGFKQMCPVYASPHRPLRRVAPGASAGSRCGRRCSSGMARRQVSLALFAADGAVAKSKRPSQPPLTKDGDVSVAMGLRFAYEAVGLTYNGRAELAEAGLLAPNEFGTSLHITSNEPAFVAQLNAGGSCYIVITGDHHEQSLAIPAQALTIAGQQLLAVCGELHEMTHSTGYSSL